MIKHLALSTCLAFGAAASAFATDDGPQVIYAGAMIDVENGKILKDRVIVVEDGLISAIGSRATLSEIDVPDDATLIDLSDMTVLPGLSDSHVHLTSDATIHGYKRLTVSTPRAAITGVVNAKTTLMAAHMIPAGRSIGITGGHCDNNLLPYQYKVKGGGVADGPWAVRAKVRENNKYGAKVIKFCGTGGVLSKGTKIGAQQFAFEEMKAIVDEAHLLGLKVAVHAHGAEGIETAIRAGVDSVEHASLISDEGLRMAKRKGTYLSMDIYVSDYILSEGEAAGILEESLEKERIVGKAQRERFQAAVRAGVNVAFGSDAGVYPHGQNGRQFAYMVEWGLSPMQAIQASTIGNAKLFGITEDRGSLTVGKRADIIAVDTDPMEDIRALEDVDFVMKDGKVYKQE